MIVIFHTSRGSAFACSEVYLKLTLQVNCTAFAQRVYTTL